MAGFEIRPAAVEEITAGEPAEVVVENARLKARAIASSAASSEIVLGADTDVAVGGRLLGKAPGPAEAAEHLRVLSGRSHEVLGGIVLIRCGEERSELIRTTVTFRELGDGEIERYVTSGEWRDRAGAYAVQGLGASLVERVDGDLSNVIGLPIPALSRMIASMQDDEQINKD